MNSKTKAILAYTAIFVIAFLSGFMVNRSLDGRAGPRWMEQRPMEHRGGPGPGPGSEMRQRLENRMSDYLELSDSQRQRFFESMEEYRENISQTMRDRRIAEQEQLEELYESFRADLSGLLDSTQLQKLDMRFHPDSVRQRRSQNPNAFMERRR
jgi:Spy/CpxP family protein refolding chaperone